MNVHILRLHPGDDLRESLTALPDALDVDAAFILSAIGSLKPAVLRYAGAKAGTMIEGDTEVLSLAGTLARRAAGGPHVHMAVSDAQGAVFGGHLMAGSIVRTTAEIVIGIAPDWRLTREADAQTGFRELRARQGR
ncbi:MAG: DNA-binding protein [Betaproteobacteria bacterium]|nr:DNA-binding protein [Betaproteobacteria bacterium]